MKFLVILFVSCFALSVYADFVPIPFEPCGEGFDEEFCKVDSVTVDECDVEGKYCPLFRGTDYQMDMKFTPKFEGSDLEVKAYAIINGVAKEFAGMNAQACDYMECPVTKGKQQSYIFNVNVDYSKPRGKFNVRWVMTQGGQKRCCFANKFEIL